STKGENSGDTTAPLEKGGDRPKADGGFALRADLTNKSKANPPLSPFFEGEDVRVADRKPSIAP
ncbi:MAG TPA: hypothetical protein VHF86_11145, partial [Xanthomonadaceae bacterium]|nr:hypothetical protein [Xanthomonadaceae bacterium]